MDIKQFVHETLVQIMAGVQSAQEAVHRGDPGDCPTINPRTPGRAMPDTPVAFDIAVVVADGAEADGRAGIKVFGIAELSAGGRSESSVSTTSRVSFTVPVRFPRPKMSEG